MGKIVLPYVERNVARGREYLNYRRDGKRYRLPTDPTSREFAERYAEIHASFNRESPKPGRDTVAALIADFKGSSDFKGLAITTQKNYLTHLRAIEQRGGHVPLRGITRRVVLAYRDAAATKVEADGTVTHCPARANYAVEVFRRLLSFGVDRGCLTNNPALRPGKLKTGTYAPWPDEAIEQFRVAAPDHLVIALDLALFTGQRLGDILRMTWAQIKDGFIFVRQGKTGAELYIPLHPTLANVLKAKREAMRDAVNVSTHIVTTRVGRPYRPDHFKHEWARAVRAAGLTGLVFHGLRKTAASRLAEAGCTTEQIKAITGHKTERMVGHYVGGAQQKERAVAAMEKLKNAQHSR